MSMSNVINNASWKQSDVLISAPVTMTHILKTKKTYAPYDINPSIVVIDEADLLLDSHLEKHVTDILRTFATQRGGFAKENKKRQFIFSCSTLTPMIRDKILNYFPDMEIVKTPGAHQISGGLDMNFIRISSEEEALAHLIDNLNPQEPTIIFCDKKTRVDRVSEFLLNR